jgi:hypothetical protein
VWYGSCRKATSEEICGSVLIRALLLETKISSFIEVGEVVINPKGPLVKSTVYGGERAAFLAAKHGLWMARLSTQRTSKGFHE